EYAWQYAETSDKSKLAMGNSLSKGIILLYSAFAMSSNQSGGEIEMGVSSEINRSDSWRASFSSLDILPFLFSVSFLLLPTISAPFLKDCEIYHYIERFSVRRGERRLNPPGKRRVPNDGGLNYI